MEISRTIMNISQLDGREKSRIDSELVELMSEFGLMKLRVKYEILYLISFLSETKQNKESYYESLKSIYKNFSDEDYVRIKEIEKTTNHDMKSVEYFLREKVNPEVGLENIHFGLTSDDINNLAWSEQVQKAVLMVDRYKSAFKDRLNKLSSGYKNILMLGRTHGQPAATTIMGKELEVFLERIENLNLLAELCEHQVKFGGSVGNLTAHKVSFPEIDWEQFTRTFIYKNTSFKISNKNTQINSSDSLSKIATKCSLLCRIINHFCKEMWSYISLGYFSQKILESEVGSSVMPQKVNPICFELAEGFSEIAEANFDLISKNLNNTRFQRDLSDHPIHRHFADTFGYLNVCFNYLLEGMSRIEVNPDQEAKGRMLGELEEHPEVLSEIVQTLLRKAGIPNSYDIIKEKTRGKKISLQDLQKVLDEYKIDYQLKFVV